MKLITALLTLTVTVLTQQACAPVVVGGAAAGGLAVHDRRTVGTVVDDQGIELKARMALHDNEELRTQTHLSVTSINGVVLLSGQAPTESLRQQAQDIVAGVDKVRHIHNEVAIAAPNSFMARSSDTLITAKVKTALFQIRELEGFDATRVKVVTEDGIVYLMGMLYRNEADAVSNTARQVGGVEKIVKLFEYID